MILFLNFLRNNNKFKFFKNNNHANNKLLLVLLLILSAILVIFIALIHIYIVNIVYVIYYMLIVMLFLIYSCVFVNYLFTINYLYCTNEYYVESIKNTLSINCPSIISDLINYNYVMFFKFKYISMFTINNFRFKFLFILILNFISIFVILHNNIILILHYPFNTNFFIFLKKQKNYVTEQMCSCKIEYIENRMYFNGPSETKILKNLITSNFLSHIKSNCGKNNFTDDLDVVNKNTIIKQKNIEQSLYKYSESQIEKGVLRNTNDVIISRTQHISTYYSKQKISIHHTHNTKFSKNSNINSTNQILYNIDSSLNNKNSLYSGLVLSKDLNYLKVDNFTDLRAEYFKYVYLVASNNCEENKEKKLNNNLILSNDELPKYMCEAGNSVTTLKQDTRDSLYMLLLKYKNKNNILPEKNSVIPTMLLDVYLTNIENVYTNNKSSWLLAEIQKNITKTNNEKNI